MGKELSNMDVALFALYKKGGISQKVHTEEIAWEAYHLAKERFSWRLPKFRQMGFPDKTPVRFALEMAKKKEYGKLVSGRSGGDISGELEGWIFTPQGANWIRKNENRILESLKQKRSDVPKFEAIRFIKRIKNDPFYKYFREKGTLEGASAYMLTDMLICSPDSAQSIVKHKFGQLYTNAELIDDIEVLRFLNSCKEKFKDLLG